MDLNSSHHLGGHRQSVDDGEGGYASASASDWGQEANGPGLRFGTKGHIAHHVRNSDVDPLIMPALLSSRESRGKPIEELTAKDLQSVRTVRQSGTDEPSAEYRALTAAAKLCMHESHQEMVDLQRDSVYSAAIVIPQFARSAGWPAQLSTLTFRTYIFLITNVLVQWYLVYSVITEETIMDANSGQMNLCNFGAPAGCPDAIGCVGPGGTLITPARLHSFQDFNLRSFVKQAFLEVLPEQAAQINDMIDPGEYGVESTNIRYVCAVIFVMGSLMDVYEIYSMLELFWVIPTAPESWMDYEDDAVILRIAGMPLHWKIINMFVVLLPKISILIFTLRAGIVFIMDTASIDDTIVNALALGFILNIDELIFETLASPQARHMVQHMVGFHLTDGDDYAHLEKGEAEEQIIEKSKVRKWTLIGFVPRRLVFCVVLTALFIADYYALKCIRSNDGSLVSRPMHLPKSRVLGFLSAVFPDFFDTARAEEPFWTMTYPTEEAA